MKLKCIKEVKGFTVGKTYELLSCAGEYVCFKGDHDEQYTLFESYFEIVK